MKQFEWSYGLYIKLTSIFFSKKNIVAPICQLQIFCLSSNIQSDKKDLLRGSYYVYTRTYFFKWLMQGSTILCMPNVRTKIVCMFQPRTYIFISFLTNLISYPKIIRNGKVSLLSKLCFKRLVIFDMVSK